MKRIVMTTQFTQPIDFSYNADLNSMAIAIKELIVAVNVLEKKLEEKEKKPVRTRKVKAK